MKLRVRMMVFALMIGLLSMAVGAWAALNLSLLPAAICMVVILVGAVFGSLLLARQVTQPMERLQAAMQALQQGDLSVRVEDQPAVGETGDLARAFNRTAEETQRWHSEQRAEVRQKSKALEKTQALLVRSQKLAAVGQLGAGVAHEINNPLTGLLGMTQLLKSKAPPEGDLHDRLGKIEAQALRIREIVQSLQRLADEEQGIMHQRIDLRSTVTDTLGPRRPQLQEKNIRVVEELDAVPEVHGDAPRLAEALNLLIDNAVLAMPEGGTLTVRSEHQDLQIVSLSIIDSGIGIQKELQGRIFEPFFTLKAAWEGKGLGLSLVNQIVEAHNGHVSVESEPGRGAIFTMSFPAAQGRALA